MPRRRIIKLRTRSASIAEVGRVLTKIEALVPELQVLGYAHPDTVTIVTSGEAAHASSATSRKASLIQLRRDIRNELVHHFAHAGLLIDPAVVRVSKTDPQYARADVIEIDISNDDGISLIERRRNRQESNRMQAQDVSIEQLQNLVDGILTGKYSKPVAGDSNTVPFSRFSTDHARNAQCLLKNAFVRANEHQDLYGIRVALEGLKDEIGRYPSGSVGHATKLFVTHHPIARKYLGITPLERRVVPIGPADSAQPK